MIRHYYFSSSIVLVMLAASAVSQGQQAHSLAFNDYAPQHMEMRIASQPQFGYLSIPGIGNAAVAVSNSMLHPARWLSQSSNAPLATIELDEVFDSWEAPNRLAVDLQMDWLQFGKFFKDKRSFVHGGIREIAHFSLELPSDLLRLPFTGNANFELLGDDALDLADFGVRAEHRRSFYLGWQRNWNEKWSSGVRVHYLRGIRHGELAIEDLKWSTNEVTWDWAFEGQGSVQSSGMWPLAQFLDSGKLDDAAVTQLQEELISGVGTGFGLDLGVEYRVNAKWLAFAQVNDLGSMRWKQDIRNLSTQSTTFEFSGLDWSAADDWTVQGAEDSLAGYGQAVADDLEQDLALDEDAVPYRTGLGAKWSLGAEFTPWPAVKWQPSLGMLVRKNGALPLSWRASWNQAWGRWMKTSLSFGARDGLGSSAGISVAWNAGPFVVTAAADSHRLLNWTAFDLDDSTGETSESIRFPTYAPLAHVQIGVVWRMGWMPKRDRSETKSECEPFAVPSSTRSPQF